VNRIKRRENYRPFAASVLLEYVNEWFDMKSLKESPYMSFAVDAKENAIQQVPSVIHVNNTCRIQTVNKKQNLHFYNLIKEFYNKTKVPMLLNTSFNLAGEPLVEIFNDALHVMNNSELKYVYFPEVKTLVFK
jgi:carbamoyltransferase